MTVFITGNDQRVIKSLSNELCNDNKIVVATNDSKAIGFDSRVVFFSLSSYGSLFEKIFKSFHFDTIIFVSSRHNSGKLVDKSELENLNRVLQLANNENLDQFIYISSSLIYGNSRQIDEKSNAVPLDSAGVMLDAGERLCRLFKENNNINVVILHVPYLYGDEGCDLLLPDMLSICIKKGTVVFPGAKEDRCDFLHEDDLADFLMQLIEDPYSQESGVVNLSSGVYLSFGDLAGYIYKAFPDTKFEYSDKSVYPVPVNIDTARRFYDFVANHRFSDEINDLIENYKAKVDDRKSFINRLKNFMQSNKTILKLIELSLGTLLMEYLNVITHTSAQFSFIDFRLLFVVIMGCTHGMSTGVIAAAIAAASYAFGYLKTGADWEVLFYNIDNWLPFVAYFIAGAVTGHSKDRSLNKELFLRNQQETLEERYVFLYELYNQTLKNKNAFRDQILGYRDSFGRIYDAVIRLDSLQHEEVFFKAIQVLEDILETRSAAIYTLDSEVNYARLVLSSEGMESRLASSLKMSGYVGIRDAIRKKEIWCNKSLDESQPSYGAAITDNGKAVAMIILWDAKYEQMTAAYLNLFKILSGLVEASLVRAINYRVSIENDTYIPGTHIMNDMEFKKLLKIKIMMRENNNARFKLLRVENKADDILWLSNTINSSIRNTDALGQMENNRLYILLSQIDDANVGLMIDRLIDRGVVCTVVEGLYI